MSVFTIKNKFLDPYDPFWICRLLSIKVGTAIILLFLINAFLKSPQGPIVYFMAVMVCTLAAELSPANTKAKKVSVFLALLFMLILTASLFSWFSYLTLGLFVLFISFTYLILRFMASNAKVAALPMFMIIWGLIQLSGGAATDLNGITNNFLFYVEFGLAGVVTIIFFPDFTPNIFKSALLRILETDLQNVGNIHYKNSHPLVLSALFMLRAKLPILPEAYGVLYTSIISFQNDVMKPNLLRLEDQNVLKAILTELIDAISRGTDFADKNGNLKALSALNEHVYTSLSQLIEGVQQCKA